jgi:hypothetical protein
MTVQIIESWDEQFTAGASVKIAFNLEDLRALDRMGKWWKIEDRSARIKRMIEEGMAEIHKGFPQNFAAHAQVER